MFLISFKSDKALQKNQKSTILVEPDFLISGFMKIFLLKQVLPRRKIAFHLPII